MRVVGGGGGGHSTFSMQIRGGRASETCTPTQEEMGLRFDLKPPSWCLVQFPKMAAHLSGRDIGKNYSKNIWFGDQARDKGRQWCSFNLTQKSKNWKGALGEMANTLGEGIAPEATGAPEGSGTGRYQCSQKAGKQLGTIN